MKCPSTKEEWEYIIDQTNNRWQFPNCYAASDGKHISIICPKNSGSQFYNFKGFFSIVLLAFVDYNYEFLIAEIGCQGRTSDGGVFKNSAFDLVLTNNSLNLPDPKPLPDILPNIFSIRTPPVVTPERWKIVKHITLQRNFFT